MGKERVLQAVNWFLSLVKRAGPGYLISFLAHMVLFAGILIAGFLPSAKPITDAAVPFNLISADQLGLIPEGIESAETIKENPANNPDEAETPSLPPVRPDSANIQTEEKPADIHPEPEQPAIPETEPVPDMNQITEAPEREHIKPSETDIPTAPERQDIVELPEDPEDAPALSEPPKTPEASPQPALPPVQSALPVEKPADPEPASEIAEHVPLPPTRPKRIKQAEPIKPSPIPPVQTAGNDDLLGDVRDLLTQQSGTENISAGSRRPSLGNPRGQGSRLSASWKNDIVYIIARHLSQPQCSPDWGITDRPIHIRIYLNPDGSLRGRPEPAAQDIISPAERGLYASAIQGIVNCAPFPIPSELSPYYGIEGGWHIIDHTFSKSQ